ncbi:MAG TPA: HNH endonuclease family protein [Allosphingosinicella sp.]
MAERLRSIYVSDERFAADFSALNLEGAAHSRKIAKYILAKLQTRVSGRECDPDTDPGTIEHILPQNPGQEWVADFPMDQWEENVERLGNLTLLEAGLNRGLANSGYPAKVAAYPQSIYELTQEIPQIAPEIWTLELLNERQRWLAAAAAQVWRSNFG